VTGKRCNSNSVVAIPLQSNGFGALVIFYIDISVTDWNKDYCGLFKPQFRLDLFKNLFLDAVELFFKQFHLSIVGV
jgi:hypothetical protein